MAEFCLKCWNELNGTEYTEADYIVDHHGLDLCEGCAELRPCIIKKRGPLGRLLWRLFHRGR